MKKAKIFILAGQSNAVGVGHTKYLSKCYDKETAEQFYRGYDNILINYSSHDIVSDGFVKTTVNCTEKSKDTLGPEVGMARVLDRYYPDEKFFIVKCAYGATNMERDWRAPSSGVPYDPSVSAEPAKAVRDRSAGFAGWCYNSLVKHLASSFGLLKDQGYELQVEAFCWMQGEGDACEDSARNAYISRYDAFLKDLRAEFAPLLDNCVYVDAGVSEAWKNYDKLNEMKRKYAEEHGYTYIDTVGAGLTTKFEPEEQPDVAHYDCGSTVRLGELFAEAIVSALKSER